jgi:hypothetical protein
MVIKNGNSRNKPDNFRYFINSWRNGLERQLKTPKPANLNETSHFHWAVLPK